MSIFPLFKKAPYLTDDEKQKIVAAIREAEQKTSGEVRVYIESKNAYVDPVDRAVEVFYNLKMDKTAERNAVLLYFAMKDKQLALFGDDGIYKATGEKYWNDAVKEIISDFSKENITESIVSAILKIGQTLKEKFPYDRVSDKNELPDEIIFGK
jgi:uncharacterized membrane protein